MRVVGSHVQESQKFSLVTTGSFQAEGRCEVNQCPRDCSAHGSCVSGTCRCDLPFYGPDCRIEMPRLVSGKPSELSVSSSRWAFYAFLCEKSSTLWTLTTEGKGNPNYFVAHERIPALSDFDLRNTDLGARAFMWQTMPASGIYVLGINAYCCDSANVTVSLTLDGASNCGSEILDQGEECDDGNSNSLDGCSAFCRVER